MAGFLALRGLTTLFSALYAENKLPIRRINVIISAVCAENNRVSVAATRMADSILG